VAPSLDGLGAGWSVSLRRLGRCRRDVRAEEIGTRQSCPGRGTNAVLDEPMAALDEYSGRQFLEALQELRGLGKIVVLVSHDSRLISFADRVYTVSNGTITPESAVIRYIQGENIKALQL